MARIAGVDLPRDKKVEIALHVHLRHRSHRRSSRILRRPGVSPDTRVRDLTDADVHGCGR